MKGLKVLLALGVLAIAVAGCAPKASPPVIQTVEVTREVTRQVTQVVFQTVVVTATPLPGPTATPPPTATVGPTPDRTLTDKGIGSYMSGTEMGTGIWRSTRIADDYLQGACYLAVHALSGDLETNSLSPLGATIRVPEGQHIIEVSNCVWSFLQP